MRNNEERKIMKNIILKILIFTPILLLGQNNIVIKGKIKGLKDSTYVGIAESIYAGAVIAETTVKNEEFVIEIQPERWQGQTVLGTKDYRPICQLFLWENDTITITGDINDLKNIVIIGGKYMNDFREGSKLDMFDNEDVRILSNSLNKAQPDNQIKILEQMIKIFENKRKNLIKFINNRPSSPVSTCLFFKSFFYFNNKNEAKVYLNKLYGDARKSIYYNSNEYYSLHNQISENTDFNIIIISNIKKLITEIKRKNN